MDFRDIVRMALDEYLEELRKAVRDLSAEERRFQPNPASHHIDFAVWHMARVEDDWVQRFARRTDAIWRQDLWYDKLGLPQQGSGFGYSAEQVTDLPEFDFHGLMRYYDSVRAETISYLGTLTTKDLEKCPHPERRPGYTIGKMLSHIIVEEAQHVGQVSYLRGIQRGLNV